MKKQITVDGHCCDACHGAGGFESAASSTNYFWKTCTDCGGTGKANPAKPTHNTALTGAEGVRVEGTVKGENPGKD